MINSQLLENIPEKPGVYLWKDKFSRVIYVGKAKSLKSRMKNYFLKSTDNRRTKFLNSIIDYEYIITNTEQEALILELNLIKKYAPEYNILLQDNKKYPYLKIKLNQMLSITIARKITKDGSFYYGPFPNGYGAMNVYKLLIHLTMYKKGILYKNKNDQEHWKKSFLLCKEILKPNNSKFKKILEKEMLDAADNLQFEIARDLKKTIESLNFYIENNDVQFMDNENIDVFGISQKNGFLSITVMFYRYGKLLTKIDKIIEINNEISELIEQFIFQFYQFNIIPTKLLISKEFFESQKDFFIKILNPVKGKYKRALNIAVENAQDNISLKILRHARKVERTKGSIEKLGILLKINKPFHIIVIDNSNISNIHPVSAIISYKNGVKQKHEYRKLNLEIGKRKADVDYMKQSVLKYFSKHEYPDLLILDGGKQQVNEIKKIIDETVPLIGLVKNDNHKLRGIVTRENIELAIKDELLKNFLQEIQEEADRFAKQHFRSKFIKNSLELKLEQIKGIGPNTIKNLLKKFKTFNAIYNASIEELKEVVSPNHAVNIYNKFSEK